MMNITYNIYYKDINANVTRVTMVMAKLVRKIATRTSAHQNTRIRAVPTLLVKTCVMVTNVSAMKGIL